MSRKRKPGKKQIQRLLAQSGFDPSEIGPLKIIADVRDPGYCELRATELIQEARAAIAQKSRINIPGGDFFVPADAERISAQHDETYHEKMRQAISLLGLARAEREITDEANASPKQPERVADPGPAHQEPDA